MGFYCWETVKARPSCVLPCLLGCRVAASHSFKKKKKNRSKSGVSLSPPLRFLPIVRPTFCSLDLRPQPSSPPDPLARLARRHLPHTTAPASPAAVPPIVDGSTSLRSALTCGSAGCRPHLRSASAGILSASSRTFDRRCFRHQPFSLASPALLTTTAAVASRSDHFWRSTPAKLGTVSTPRGELNVPVCLVCRIEPCFGRSVLLPVCLIGFFGRKTASVVLVLVRVVVGDDEERRGS